jgi:nucleotide-binding universal stress UspA family protein
VSPGPIILCYDGSDAARDAISAAARILGGGAATVLHVWKAPAQAPSKDSNTPWGDELAGRLRDDARRHAERVAAEGSDLAAGLGFEAEPVAVESLDRVPEMIVEEARRRRAPLVVMGSRGLSGVASVLLGSVSTTVLHASPSPVLVIPHGHP